MMQLDMSRVTPGLFDGAVQVDPPPLDLDAMLGKGMGDIMGGNRPIKNALFPMRNQNWDGRYARYWAATPMGLDKCTGSSWGRPEVGPTPGWRPEPPWGSLEFGHYETRHSYEGK